MSDEIAANGVQTHKIDFDKKTLVALTFPFGISRLARNNTCDWMTERLREWRESEQPFLVIGLVNGMKIEFKRKSDAEPQKDTDGDGLED